MPVPVDITSIQKLQPLYKPYYPADKKIPNHLIKMHDFEPDDFSANKQELSELLSAAHETGEEYTRLFVCTEGDAAVKQQAMQDYLDRFEFGSKIKIEVIQGNSLPIDSPKRKSVNNKISGEVCLTSGHYDEALRREAEFQDKLKVDKNKTIAEWQINEAEIRRNAKNIIRNYIQHHPDAEISITAPPVLFLQMINEAKQLENEPEKPEDYITPAELGALFSKISQINMTGGFNWRDFFESLTDPREVENMENLINDFVNMFSGKFILAISDLTAHMLLTHEVDPSGTSIQESTKSITDLKYSNFTESYDEAEREFMVYWTKNKIRPDDFRFLRTCLYAIFPEGGISFKDLPAWDKLQPVFQRQFFEFDFSSQTITHEQWIPIFEGNFNKNVSD